MSGPKWWSATAVTTFEQCPQKFWHRYVNKTPREKTDTPLHWIRGTVVHGALEAAMRLRKAQGGSGDMWTPDNWAAAKEGIRKEWAKAGLPDPGEDGETLYGELSNEWNLVHLHAETALKDLVEDAKNIVAPEYQVLIKGNPTMVGYIDLLRNPEPGVYHIRDYKNRSTPAKPAELFRDFQGNFYGGMVLRLFTGVKKLLFSHYYPPIAKEVLVELDIKNAQAAVERLKATKDMVDAETKWTPDKGSWCQNCAYIDVCPAWQETDPVKIAASINDI